MLKNSSWKLDETNLANFGSELEREHRKAEGALETAWNYEGSPIGHEVGMWIWRVQSFNLTTVPKSQYGQFYQGDSYIVLKSTKKENTDGLIHNIHFWLGLETTQDEAGTAAYKTVELDDFLDTYAVQHREVQKRESRLFSSYFKTITYLQGGFDSGFNHVEEEELHTRLLRIHKPKQLEGSRTRNAVVISEVALSHESLRSTAVFVLDTGDIIYQWQGENANGIERAKAAEFISQLISERNGKGEMVIVEQGSGSGERDFFEALGSNGTIADDDSEETEDEEEDEQVDGNKKLLRLSSSGPFGMGHLKFEVVAEGTISKDMFDTNDVFVFDVGHQVYTWIGHKASRKERRHGLEYAQKYVKECPGRSAFTPICQVVEGGEDELFEASLEGWQGW
ncbi:gelsolin-like protein 2-like isoform X3 [Mucor ambiguus]|uniref:Gelsolin-like protein 2-like isoform X3 n=1 Tax=Mucor ambiguus TaxID=91626 RepID=A0A0C9LYJ9_9FUNG|nr:gelsolin-like protein 2-like isoform X3 [Mucor ambiguus]